MLSESSIESLRMMYEDGELHIPSGPTVTPSRGCDYRECDSATTDLAPFPVAGSDRTTFRDDRLFHVAGLVARTLLFLNLTSLASSTYSPCT